MSDALCGVIIGGIITAVFTWFLDYLKTKREEKTYIKRKSEAVYLKMLNVLLLHRQEICLNKKEITEELTNKLNEYYPEINIYASKNLKEIYNTTIKNLKEKNEEKVLINAIRKELGIKD